MAIVSARCTSCGAGIQVDDAVDAGICPNCGTAFVTEKAINNNITNVTNNIETAIFRDSDTMEQLIEKYNAFIKLLHIDYQVVAPKYSIKGTIQKNIDYKDKLETLVEQYNNEVEMWLEKYNKKTEEYTAAQEAITVKYLKNECEKLRNKVTVSQTNLDKTIKQLNETNELIDEMQLKLNEAENKAQKALSTLFDLRDVVNNMLKLYPADVRSYLFGADYEKQAALAMLNLSEVVASNYANEIYTLNEFIKDYAPYENLNNFKNSITNLNKFLNDATRELYYESINELNKFENEFNNLKAKFESPETVKQKQIELEIKEEKAKKRAINLKTIAYLSTVAIVIIVALAIFLIFK